MKVLRVKSVAALMDVTPRSVWRYARDPKMEFPQPIPVGPGVTAFSADEIDEWLKERAAKRAERVEGRAR